MTSSHVASLQTLGFTLAGRFDGRAFHLAPGWSRRSGVYVWTRGAKAEEVLRVGIATGASGFASRYASYNRWLAGRFKPENAMEQTKAALFRARLDSSCAVWVREVADRGTALALEGELRAHWGSVLELDLMAQGSWAKAEMKRWRENRLDAASSDSRTREAPPRDSAAGLVQQNTRAARPMERSFPELEGTLRDEGLSPSSGRDGVSYCLGRARLTAVHAKPSKGCHRVWVGCEAERMAPAELRGHYKQEGWLVVWPEHRALAAEYVMNVVRRRLAEIRR